MIELRCPLERRVRLGYETTDAHRALDVASTGRLPTGFDDFLRHRGNLQNIVIGFRRQPAHEVQLHVTPTRRVRSGDRTNEVFFRHLLIDHPAHALAAALGSERQSAPTSITGELVGEVDVERVDPRTRQGKGGLRVLISVGEVARDVGDLGVIRTRQRQQAHLLEACCFQPAFNDLRDPGDGALAHGPGDHAGLAEPTPAGAPPKDLHTHALVHRFGERHEWRFRVRPFVQIHQRVLADPPRDVRAIRCHPLNAPIR